jgi:mRNA interferase HigB
LNEFAREHPECASSLAAWYRIVKRTDFDSFEDVRRIFPGADQVGRFTVFNIGGNKARLIAAIHYNRKKVYIRQVLTHAQCDRGTWKE